MAWIILHIPDETAPTAGPFTIGLSVLLAGIGAIAPIIAGTSYISFCNHKDQVSVSDVRMTGKNHADDTYVNGINQVSFDGNITIGEYDLIYCVAHTLVFQNSQCIGYIKSQLKGPKQETHSDGGTTTTESYWKKNTSYSFSFTLEDQAGNTNSLLYKLYSEDNFTFRSLVVFTSFTDGTSITLDNYYGSKRGSYDSSGAWVSTK